MSEIEFVGAGEVARAAGKPVQWVNNLLKTDKLPISAPPAKKGVPRQYLYRDFLVVAVAAHLDRMLNSHVGGIAAMAVDAWLSYGKGRTVYCRRKTSEDEAGWANYELCTLHDVPEDARIALVIETQAICEEAEHRLKDILAVKRAAARLRERTNLGGSDA